jgi:hypothetical protein
MKELYSFDIARDIVTKTPYTKKTKKGEVEAFRNKTTKKNTKIVIEKPSISEIEKAEFFFGQKYNEYINAGFLTKAMLLNKIGEAGTSSISEEVRNAVTEYLEASRVIEFYEGADKLTEDQEKKLNEAKKKFAETQMLVHEHESNVRGQYSQTAETKAEEKMIEWFIFNFSYYEDEADGEKTYFPLFEGNNFEEKRAFFLELSEDKEDIDRSDVLNAKDVFDESFDTIAKAVNIWYNKLGSNKKEIDAKIKEIFD